MTQTHQTLRLRSISGEHAGKWLWTIGLAAKTGIPFRGSPAFEDVERHPEKYVVIPTFIDVEKSAWRALSLEMALQHQLILKRAGFETELA